jgi:hypothetical protein
MPVNDAPFIDGLNQNEPNGGSPKSLGDQELKEIKRALKGTFPNLSGEVTLSNAELNDLPSDIDEKADITGQTFTGTIDAPVVKVAGVDVTNIINSKGTMSQFFLRGDSTTNTPITNGNTITIRGGTNCTTSQDGVDRVTVNVPSASSSVRGATVVINSVTSQDTNEASSDNATRLAYNRGTDGINRANAAQADADAAQSTANTANAKNLVNNSLYTGNLTQGQSANIGAQGGVFGNNWIGVETRSDNVYHWQWFWGDYLVGGRQYVTLASRGGNNNDGVNFSFTNMTITNNTVYEDNTAAITKVVMVRYL